MLAVTAALSAPSLHTASAQDAGPAALDAGGLATADAGGLPTPAAAGVELVFPRPGATGVVTNPGLLLRLDGAILDPSRAWQWPPDPPALGEGLLLRDASGGLIAVGPLVALETARALYEERAAPNAHVEVSTAPLVLTAETRYDVLSRVAVCAADAGQSVACLQDHFRVLGTFTTGTAADRQGPVITGAVVHPSPGECLAALTLLGSDDRAPPEALRFGPGDVGVLGPDVLLPTPLPRSADAPSLLMVVPIDPSGNRGPAFEVEIDTCQYLWEGNDVIGLETVAPRTPSPPPLPSRGSGCALSPVPTSRAASGLGPLALASLCALSSFRSRRPRAAARARRQEVPRR